MKLPVHGGLINQTTLRISAFPAGRIFWRVDWFGEISYPDRTTRRTQPSVLVYLSKVSDPSYLDAPERLLQPSATSNEQVRRWVSVGTLAILQVGDIWQDRQLVFRPSYDLDAFEQVEIAPTTTHLVKAGHSSGDDSFLLPLAEHPWHRQNTHSYCVAVDLPEDRQFVIPCMELIRFYFGSSGSLLSKLFLPPLQRTALYSAHSFNKDVGFLQLKLAAGISGASSTDIGRLSLDGLAWRAALQVGTSMLRGSQARQAIHVQTFFPFEGHTTMVAAGKWLPGNKQARQTFIVYNLRSCSHPFPFSALRYDMQEGAQDGRRSVQKSVPTTKTIQVKSAAKVPVTNLTERDASSTLVPKELPAFSNDRFPYLRGKFVWKRKTKGTESVVNIEARGTALGVSDGSVGDSGSDQRVRPVDLTAQPAQDWEPKSAPPAFLHEFIAELRELKGIDLKWRTGDSDDGWTNSLPLIPDETGDFEKVFIMRRDGTELLRRVAIVSIKNAASEISAVCVEAEPPFIGIFGACKDGVGERVNAIEKLAEEYVRRQRNTDGSFLSKVEAALAARTSCP